jgi:hypothetical protein
VSKILVSECKSITGLDISKDFVNDFNADAASLGVQDKMFAKCVDISENPDALEGAKYDLIFVSLLPYFPIVSVSLACSLLLPIIISHRPPT